MLMMGCDCEQEATDAMVDLEINVLQQKYGDDWRQHAHPSTLYYYDQMMERRQQSLTAEDIPEPNHESPPGTGIV